MAYTYLPDERATARSVYDFRSTPDEVTSEAFADAWETNPIAALANGRGPIADMVRLNEAYRTGPKVDAAGARGQLKELGLESQIKVDDTGITQAALDELVSRKQAENRRREVMGLSEGGLAQGAKNLGVSMFAGFADPLGMALNFVPVVGEARYAAILAKGGFAARTATRLAVGALEAGVGNIPLEALNYASKRYEQADYGIADSLLNVLYGAAFGSVLHAGVGAAGEGIGRALGRENPYTQFRGLGADDVRRVMNLREDIRAGGMADSEIRTILDTWTPEMRRAVASDLPTSLRTEAAAAPDRILATDLSQETRTALTRVMFGQALEDRPIDIEGVLRTEIGQMKDGRSTLDLTPERFTVDVVAGRLDELQASIEARMAEAKGEPTMDPREMASLERQRQAVQALRAEGGPRIAGETAAPEPTIVAASAPAPRASEPSVDREAIRQAAVRLAAEDGAVVPKLALAGASEHTIGKAESIRADRTMRDFIEHAQNSVALTNEDRALVDTANREAGDLVAKNGDDEVAAAVDEETAAEAEMKLAAERAGLPADDAETVAVNEAAKNAERWARTAELATACLLNGID